MFVTMAYKAWAKYREQVISGEMEKEIE